MLGWLLLSMREINRAGEAGWRYLDILKYC